MHRFLTPFLRRLYAFFAAFLFVYAAFYGVEHTAWNKERLYKKLLSGNYSQQLSAGFDLVWLGGEDQLLRALKSPSMSVREIAANSLWSLWFHAAGREAFHLAQSANAAIEQHKLSDALAILNQTVAKYPDFAEGWNRRAIVFWQMKQYKESVADCKKVVALNPDHFAAWQGMGLCQLHLGDVEGACESFRSALKINPHDPGLRQLLQQCEELRRRLSPKRSDTIEWI